MPDAAAKLSFEVRLEDSVVGPVTLDQVKRGRSAGKIPDGAEMRSIGAWRTVSELLAGLVRVAGEKVADDTPFEVRVDDAILGPMTLEQIRCGRKAGRIPGDAAARPVSSWQAVEQLISAWQAPRRAPAPPRGRSWYFVVGASQPLGPVATEQIKMQLSDGTLGLSTQVCLAGDKVWQPIWDVPEFAETIRHLPKKPAAKPGPVPGGRAKRWQLRLSEHEQPEQLSTDEIRQQLRSRRIPIAAEVCPAGGIDWTPIWDVDEFAAAVKELPTTSSRPPPPHQPAEPHRAGVKQKWYVAVSRQPTIGPLTSDEVSRRLRAGTIPETAHIRALGSIEWRPIAEVAELSEPRSQPKCSEL